MLEFGYLQLRIIKCAKPHQTKGLTVLQAFQRSYHVLATLQTLKNWMIKIFTKMQFIIVLNLQI